MVDCSKCGASITEKSKFCCQCGEPIEAEEIKEDKASESSQLAISTKPKDNRIGIILSIVFIGILVIVIGIAVYSNSDYSKNADLRIASKQAEMERKERAVKLKQERDNFVERIEMHYKELEELYITT